MTAMGESDVGVRNFEASAVDLVWRSHSHFGVGRDRRSVWLTGSQSPRFGSSVCLQNEGIDDAPAAHNRGAQTICSSKTNNVTIGHMEGSRRYCSVGVVSCLKPLEKHYTRRCALRRDC